MDHSIKKKDWNTLVVKDLCNEDPSLSIIIVNWNVRELLKGCIESILDCVRNTKYEIIVVDNNSNDGSIEMIERQFKGVIAIANQKNTGFAKANNKAIEIARGRNILFLNPDTEIRSFAIQDMANILDSNDTIGCIGCKITYPDGSIYLPCARGFPTPLNTLLDITMMSKIFPKIRLFDSKNRLYLDRNHSRSADCLVGACMMVKRKVLDQVGSFNEKYFMYGEDIDLCYRIKKAGFQNYYYAEQSIIHYGEASSRKAEKDKTKYGFSKIYVLYESNMLFMRINYGLFNAVLFRIFVLWGALLRIFAISMVRALTKISWIKSNVDYRETITKYRSILKWAIHGEIWKD